MPPWEWNWFMKRSGIEPIIGHLKLDHCMDRNCPKGDVDAGIFSLLIV